MPEIRWTRSLCRRVGLTLAAVLIFVLALTTHAPDKSGKSSGKDNSSSLSDSSQKADEKMFETKYEKMDNSAVKNTGFILLDNKDHAYVSDGSDFVPIYQYLFDSNGEQIMTTSSTNISGNKDMMVHLNAMIGDFVSATSLKTIMVLNASYMYDSKLYKTQYDVPAEDTKEKQSDAQQSRATSSGCYEHLSGLAVDFQLYEIDKGTFPEYTGEGSYAWINENCWKYGFVLRYPDNKQDVTGVAGKKNHYRYVGAAYAQIMHENDLALEELYGFLDKYSYEKPLTFTTPDGKQKMVYSVKLDEEKGSTTVPIPDTGRSDMSYEISGNDMGSIYICADLGSVMIEGDSSQPDSSQAAKSE